jgi:hypothetical protein
MNYGNIGVAVIFQAESYKIHYKVVQQTLKCYLNRTDYSLELIDLFNDVEVEKYCNHTQVINILYLCKCWQLYFRKHYAAAVYLTKHDWIFVLETLIQPL